MPTAVYEAACVLSASPGQYSETRWVVAQVHSECGRYLSVCAAAMRARCYIKQKERKKTKKKHSSRTCVSETSSVGDWCWCQDPNRHTRS